MPYRAHRRRAKQLRQAFEIVATDARDLARFLYSCRYRSIERTASTSSSGNHSNTGSVSDILCKQCATFDTRSLVDRSRAPSIYSCTILRRLEKTIGHMPLIPNRGPHRKPLDFDLHRSDVADCVKQGSAEKHTPPLFERPTTRAEMCVFLGRTIRTSLRKKLSVAIDACVQRLPLPQKFRWKTVEAKLWMMRGGVSSSVMRRTSDFVR